MINHFGEYQVSNKERLDVLLANRGYCKSRTKAQRQIMAGNVLVNGELHDKPGKRVSPDSEITLQADKEPYVSRGGRKLEHAIDTFEVDIRAKQALDIGSSTGGFVDCLLQTGAKEVWAVDVGKGQLDWNLRNDPLVHVLENTNARYLKPDDIGSQVDLVTIDVSFISLKLILPNAQKVLRERGKILALVKPQFEAGPKLVERGGVVTDPAVHADVISKITKFSESLGLPATDATYSPIRGKSSKNIEYFLLLCKTGKSIGKHYINHIVESAHSSLSKLNSC